MTSIIKSNIVEIGPFINEVQKAASDTWKQPEDIKVNALPIGHLVEIAAKYTIKTAEGWSEKNQRSIKSLQVIEQQLGCIPQANEESIELGIEHKLILETNYTDPYENEPRMKFMLVDELHKGVHFSYISKWRDNSGVEGGVQTYWDFEKALKKFIQWVNKERKSGCNHKNLKILSPIR